MSVADMFKEFLENLKVDNSEQVSLRYGEITKCLNKKFRNSESTTDNTLQVGSYGRYTGIKGISDLDMLYIMPSTKWETYKSGKQSQLLTDVKDAIKARYPKTDVRVDRLVVTVKYQNFHVEVQPVFNYYDSNDDEAGYFKYPDTYKGGSWKNTKPRQEMKAIKDLNDKKNKNLRLLCKMARAWKNKSGTVIGGLLIDTLAYKFMDSTSYYDDKSYAAFDCLSCDFFKYLSEQDKQDHYQAPGSNQDVKVRKDFRKKAKEAYELCLEAIEAEGTSKANKKWRDLYGRSFPAAKVIERSADKTAASWQDTEEFIEDRHPIDIRYDISLDCDVSQNGFRENTLGHMLMKRIPLLANKKLLFRVVECDVPEDFTLKWKVLNRGVIAQQKNQIRGQIVNDDGYGKKSESTSFQGEHFVECYAIKDGVVVARASIDVPIQ